MARRFGVGSMFVVLIATCLVAAQAPQQPPPGGPPSGAPPAPIADPVGDRLYAAIRTNDIPALRELLKTSDVNYVERRGGATPLMNAAAFGSLDAMRVLLDAGANVNARSYARASALMWAVGDPAKVRLLVERGADVNAISEVGHSPLQLAAMSDGSAATVKYLLEHKANPQLVDGQKATTLTAATIGNDTGSIRQLIEAGVDVNAADEVGFTPLMNAAALGNLEAVRLLLAKGARVNAVSGPPAFPVKNGTIALGNFTPLLLASTYGPSALVKALLDAGADVNVKDARGMTPLMLAVTADHGDPAIAAMLIEKRADPNVKSLSGESALDWAHKAGPTPRITLLERAGAKGAPPAVVPVRATASAASAGRTARDAAQRGIAISEQMSAVYLARGGCAACHAQNITDVAVGQAARAGIRVDAAAAEGRAQGAAAQFGSIALRFLERIDPPAVEISMNTLLAFDAHGYKADRATDALVFNTVAQQGANGAWPTFGVSRPPMADGAIPTTALGVKTIAAYGMPGRAVEMKERLARSMAWLRSAKVSTSDDRAYRLLGLQWGGAPTDELKRLAQEALATQRSDGGWSQRAEMQSDAYATGLTLFAVLSAGVPANDARVAKGISYLVSTQKDDGSWFVRSRAPKFQPYFDGGFPYEHDQWISAMATGWSTAAIASSLRP